MQIVGRPGVFRWRSSAVRGFQAQDQEELRIGAAMAHVQELGNLDGFAGSRSERLALMTTAIRRGLVAWDRSRGRYTLSAVGQTYLDLYAPRPPGKRPRSTRDKSGRRWGSLPRAASIAAVACLALTALEMTGTWRITSYFANPVSAHVEGPDAAPAAPKGDRLRAPAAVAMPLPTASGQAGDEAEPVSRQTAVARLDEPATRQASATAKAGSPTLAKETTLHRRHHASRSSPSHRNFEPPRALGFAEADPYRRYRGWNSFGRSDVFGSFP